MPETLAGKPPLPPILFLHGFMGNRYDWQIVAESLGDRHHVLAADLPGHGTDSVDVPVELDMSGCSKLLAAQISKLGLAPIALCGYSMGGRLALYLAVNYPDTVDRLILESASPGLDTDAKRTARAAQDIGLSGRLAKIQAGSTEHQAFLEDWYDMPLFASIHRHPALLAELVERRLAQGNPARQATALCSLGTGIQPSLWPELPDFTTPTLLLTGEMDRKYRIIAEDMAQACPAMAVEILADCGHNVHLERPDAFIASTRAFLAT